MSRESLCSWAHSCVQLRFRRNDGSGKLTGVVLIFRDVRKQRETENALRISEKLAATGKLAATVAHEINNALEAVSNLLYLIHDEALSEPGKQCLKLAEEQLRRVSHIARQTLAFYRDPRRPKRLTWNAVCDHVLDLYRPRFSNSGMLTALLSRWQKVVTAFRRKISPKSLSPSSLPNGMLEPGSDFGSRKRL